MPFNPTSEQEAILAAFTAGKNLVVQAGAGTGKTTTLKLLANSTEAYGTYLAFNKSIAAEAKRSFPHTIRAMTAHSLAWQEYGNKFADRMNAERQGWTPTIKFLNAEPMSFRLHDKSRRTLTAYQTARHAVDTVKAFCQSDDTKLSARHVPLIPGLDRSFTGRRVAGENHSKLCDRILPMARRVWADVQHTEGVIQFDHAFYLKQWALTEPIIGGQYLLFDEAQDASPVIAGVVNRQTHLQLVFVGDTSQQIMAFAGAIDAMEKFATKPAVEVLSLTESFRFGPTIAAAANVLLDGLGAPLRLTGTKQVESVLASLDGTSPTATASDAVLCRTNAGALDEVITLQQRDRRVCLLGGAAELRRFVEAARELQTTGKTNFFSLMAFESWAQVQEHVAEDPAGDDLSTMVELVDQYGVDVLLSALNACVHESAADVIVSTAHKAKGREWDAVRISPDFELDDEAPPEVQSAEMMLAYVAITRAKKVLDPGLLGPWVQSAPTALAPLPKPAATPIATDAADTPAADLPEVSDDETALAEDALAADGGQEAPLTLPVSEATYDLLVNASLTWGGTPEALAERILSGALSAFQPNED
jgi:hypothetical protein